MQPPVQPATPNRRELLIEQFSRRHVLSRGSLASQSDGADAPIVTQSAAAILRTFDVAFRADYFTTFAKVRFME